MVNEGNNNKYRLLEVIEEDAHVSAKLGKITDEYNKLKQQLAGKEEINI
jgi:hypothetical protein